MSAKKQVPVFRWAEDKNQIYLTIELVGVTDAKVTIASDKLSFEGTSNKTAYELILTFKGAVETKESSWAVKDREVQILLKKSPAGFWKTLLKDKGAFKDRIKTDWELSQLGVLCLSTAYIAHLLSP